MPSSDLANQHGRQGDGTPSDGDADEVLEGGFVPALQDYFVEQKHRADTARRLAYALVCLLGGTVFIHYVGVLILVLNGRGDAVESLSRIFNVWLPVISSLVGAAVTYYFTREK